MCLTAGHRGGLSMLAGDPTPRQAQNMSHDADRAGPKHDQGRDIIFLAFQDRDTDQILRPA